MMLNYQANTWNPSDKSSLIALSGANLTAARSTLTGGAFASVRGTNFKSAGKFYFEIHIDTDVDGETFQGVMSSVTATTSYPGSDTHGIGCSYAGSINYNGSPLPQTGSTFQGGDRVGVAVDFDAQKFWYRVNNGSWSGTSGNPATGVGGASFSGATGPFATAYAASNNSASQITAKFSGGFTDTAPAGFAAWG